MVAGVIAVGVTAAVLSFSGIAPFQTFARMVEFGTRPDSLVQIINTSTTYYLAAVAVAIGFKMGLFNIGVDGQYRLAALLAAAVGGYLVRSEEHTSELQSRFDLVCRLLLEKKMEGKRPRRRVHE